MPHLLPFQAEHQRLKSECEAARRAILTRRAEIQEGLQTGGVQLVDVARHHPLATLAGVTVATAAAVTLLQSVKIRRLAFKGALVALRGVVPFV